jgi:hypothetical protein
MDVGATQDAIDWLREMVDQCAEDPVAQKILASAIYTLERALRTYLTGRE